MLDTSKVNLTPNERVDDDDFPLIQEHGANLSRAYFERLVLANRATVAAGFRVAISNQTTYPGQITVVNGLAFDRDGRLVQNEDAQNASRTITLLGANLTFSIEVEFVWNGGDSDGRAFWDQTYDNGTDPSGDPKPDGREFKANIATRLKPDWQIVTPPSTSGFQYEADPNSLRIPIAQIATNGVGAITVAANPGLITEAAASVIEEVIGSNKVRVLNSRELPSNGSITVGEGASTSENANLVENDRENGILTFSPALINSHNAGEIVREAGASPVLYLKDRRTQPPVAGDEDRRVRMWQGNENRGARLYQGTDSTTDVSDLSLQTLKDYVDFMAGQIREMRWGSASTSGALQAPPVAFTAGERYYARAGSLMGVRSRTISIGDGTTSWGDLNGTTDAVFQQAADLVRVSGPDDGGERQPGGIIHVKTGAYTLSNTVYLYGDTTVVGDGMENTFINVVSGDGLFWYGEKRYSSLAMQDFTIRRSATAGTVADLRPTSVEDGSIFSLVAGGPDFWGVYATRVAFWGTVNFAGGILMGRWVFDDCRFQGSGQGSGEVLVQTSSQLTNATFKRCKFRQTSDQKMIDFSDAENVVLEECYIESSVTSWTAGRGMIEFGSGAARCEVRSCRFQPNGGSYDNSVHLVKATQATQIRILRCELNVYNEIAFEFVGCTRSLIEENTITVWNTDGTARAAINVTVASGAAHTDDVRVVGNHLVLGMSPTGGQYGIGLDPLNDGTYKVRRCEVIGNRLDGMAIGIRFGQGYTERTSIKDNKLYSLAFADQMENGIRAISGSTLEACNITNNLIDGVTKTPTITTVFAGIDIDGTVGSTDALRIVGNHIPNVGDPGDGNAAYGIRLNPTGGNTSIIQVRDNVIENVQALQSTYGIACVVAASAAQLDFAGNSIYQVGTTATVTHPQSVGIYVKQAWNVRVTGNHIYGVGKTTSMDATQEASGIWLGNAAEVRHAVVTGNMIGSVSQGTSVTAGTAGGAIQWDGGEGCTISGNTIWTSSSDGSGSTAILVTDGAQQARNVNISGNSISSTASTDVDAWEYGIRVYCATNGFLNAIITGNSVQGVGNSAAARSAISVRGKSESDGSSVGAVVTGNSVYEVAGEGPRAAVGSNAILISTCRAFAVAGNVAFVLAANAGIETGSCSQGTIVGNAFGALTTAGLGIWCTSSTISAALVGNALGGTPNTGISFANSTGYAVLIGNLLKAGSGTNPTFAVASLTSGARAEVGGEQTVTTGYPAGGGANLDD